jgi:hypothetical protein
MDPKSNRANGVFLHGVVISNSARVITRKDKSGQFVSVTHEIALQPGVAVYQKTYNLGDAGIKVIDEKVTEFPKLKEFQPISLKLNRYKGESDKLAIYDADDIS